MNNRYIDLAWLGGIIDGEGSIHFTNKFPRIHITNTDLGLLEEVLRIAQCGSVILAAPATDKHKCKYQWALNQRPLLRDFLTLITPYLRAKNKQANLLLEWIDISPYRKHHVPKPERCNDIIKEVNALNRRGPVIQEVAA